MSNQFPIRRLAGLPSSAYPAASPLPQVTLGSNGSVSSPMTWAGQPRDDLLSPGGIPGSTHTSGEEVRHLSKNQSLWPSMRTLTPDTLNARHILITDALTKVARAATAREVLDYLNLCYPGLMVFKKEMGTIYNEADVTRLAHKSCYDSVDEILKDKLHDARKNNTCVERHSQFAAKARKRDNHAASTVFLDDAFILTPSEGIPAFGSGSQWVKPNELPRFYGSIDHRKVYKSLLLALEFKKYGTNVSSNAGTEWAMIPHPAHPRAYIPHGNKTDKVFAQSLVYAKYHGASKLILDDWCAPMLLTFSWTGLSSTRGTLPASGGILHLASAGSAGTLSSMTAREAAIFCLADSLAGARCLSVSSHIDGAKLIADMARSRRRNPPQTGRYGLFATSNSSGGSRSSPPGNASAAASTSFFPALSSFGRELLPPANPAVTASSYNAYGLPSARSSAGSSTDYNSAYTGNMIGFTNISPTLMPSLRCSTSTSSLRPSSPFRMRTSLGLDSLEDSFASLNAAPRTRRDNRDHAGSFEPPRAVHPPFPSRNNGFPISSLPPLASLGSTSLGLAGTSGSAYDAPFRVTTQPGSWSSPSAVYGRRPPLSRRTSHNDLGSFPSPQFSPLGSYDSSVTPGPEPDYQFPVPSSSGARQTDRSRTSSFSTQSNLNTTSIGYSFGDDWDPFTQGLPPLPPMLSSTGRGTSRSRSRSRNTSNNNLLTPQYGNKLGGNQPFGW